MCIRDSLNTVYQCTAKAAPGYVPVAGRIEVKALTELLAPLLDFVNNARAVVNKLLNYLSIAQIESVVYDRLKHNFTGKGRICSCILYTSRCV